MQPQVNNLLINCWLKYQKSSQFYENRDLAVQQSMEQAKRLNYDNEYSCEFFNSYLSLNLAKLFMKFVKNEIKGKQKQFLPNIEVLQEFCDTILKGEQSKLQLQQEIEENNVELNMYIYENEAQENFEQESSINMEESNFQQQSQKLSFDESADTISDKESTNCSDYSPEQQQQSSKSSSQFSSKSKISNKSKRIKKNNNNKKSLLNKKEYKSKINKNQHQNIINQFYSQYGIDEQQKINDNLKFESFKQFEVFCQKTDKNELELRYFEKLQEYFKPGGRCEVYYLVEKKDKMKNREGLDEKIQNLQEIVSGNSC